MLTNKERIIQIRERLVQNLQPEKLQIIDESHLHAGHEGAASGAGHFAIVIRSDLFHEKSTVESHRMIYEALGELMGSEIHALRIRIEK